jgi:hypothetical protein
MYEKYKTIFAGLFPKKNKGEKGSKSKITFSKADSIVKSKFSR